MGLRSRLREETAEAHARVERFIAFDASAWSLARYGDFVRCIHAFHRDAEGALGKNASLARALPDLALRRKSPWLARDLAALRLAPLDTARSIAELDPDLGRAMGWAYVLEGATLGGRVLYKRVAARWSLDRERGAAYLFGYGEETARMWARFTAALDAAPLDAAQANAAVQGANEAFASMEEWFGRNAWHG